VFYASIILYGIQFVKSPKTILPAKLADYITKIESEGLGWTTTNGYLQNRTARGKLPKCLMRASLPK